MIYLNKKEVQGRLGQDIELRTTNGGNAVTNFSVATKYKDETTWHRVTAFGQQAEYLAKYAKKGSEVYADGRSEVQKWQDENGTPRETHVLIAHSVKAGGNSSEDAKPDVQKADVSRGPTPVTDFDDDIPF